MRDHAGETGLNAILYVPCAARILRSLKRAGSNHWKTAKPAKDDKKDSENQ